ncbi:MAG: metal ABC transporter permease [Chloroflexota bacterium]
MSMAQIEIQLIAAVVAAACALPGTFLILRRMAMMSDAISHTVLLGIVLAFFVVQEFGHPLLMIGAALMGILTVSLVELLNRTRLVKEDAAIGIVFPALFSIAVLLISIFARNVHLDTHMVFQGDLVFAPFERLTLFGMDLGPRTLIVMGVILLLNLLFILLFYKELKISTFDAGLAASLGFSPVLIHYALTAMVSITAVGAFDAVGSILVVALMVVPPATAYLLTDRLDQMLYLSVGIGVLGAIGGYWLAHQVDANIAGAMVTVIGLLFLVGLLLSPSRGLLTIIRRRLRQRWEFAQSMLTIHLLHHEGDPDAQYESRIEHLLEHIRWEPDFAEQVVRYAERKGLIRRHSGNLQLTEEGRVMAQQAMIH